MSETLCPQCGGRHQPGTGACPEFPLAGLTLPDGLRVLEKLDEGTRGDVYLAEYPDSHLQVKLLILRPEAEGREPDADGAGLVLLRDRLRSASRIEHPNIARVRAIGETEEGTLGVAVDALQGELLTEILNERDVLPPPEAIDLILQVASGLQAAHEVGLVHGNLSPDTILVTRTAESRPLVKLIGFESVQHGAEPSVAAGSREGHAWSTRYAAPERLTGDSLDERSDVFSLGAVLQHLLTGEPPMTGEPPSAGPDTAARIPEAVRRVLAKALEPPPDDRFQTVAAFARALATAISKPPAQIRRGARSAGGVGGLLAVAASFAVATVWFWWTTERSELGHAGAGTTAAGDPVTTGEVREPPSTALDSNPMLLPESRRPVASPRPLASSAARPDEGAASDSMLVDVRSVDTTIQVDLRYATANNLTGAPLPGYEANRALLRREAAAALGRVQADLRSKGLGLRVFDAYRPVRASLAMVDWAERTGQSALLESGYIAGRSRHNLGVAVDLTLVDIATGTEVPMGTNFDDVTTAEARMANASGDAARNRQILVQAMTSQGFRPYDQTWWHFNYPLKGAVPLDRVIR